MISVIMPVYNAEKFIGEAISSVLSQTYDDFELVIVNDGSTDDSESIIKSFDDPRIRYFVSENGGEASARNVGLEKARGEIIVWQDADDISLPSRLGAQIEVLEETCVGFVHSDLLLISENREPIGYWQSQQVTRKRVLNFLLKVGTPFNNPSIMIKRELLEGKKFDSDLLIGTDTDMVRQFGPAMLGIHIPEPLLLYRIHSSNLSRTGTSDTVNRHVTKLLQDTPLDRLCPEFCWEDSSKQHSNIVRAHAIIALSLSRRGMKSEASAMFAVAQKSASTHDEKMFVQAIRELDAGVFATAIGILNKLQDKDYISKNYEGEAFGLLGQTNKAFDLFMSALIEKPDYDEAIRNLRSVGCARGLKPIDPSWSKYLPSS